MTNESIRRSMRVTDVAGFDRRYTGYLMRTQDKRWTKKVTDWRPRTSRRIPGRPKIWWMTKTSVRIECRKIGEVFIHKWNKNGGRYEWDNFDRLLLPLYDKMIQCFKSS